MAKEETKNKRILVTLDTEYYEKLKWMIKKMGAMFPQGMFILYQISHNKIKKSM